MNGIFTTIFCMATIIFLFCDPNAFLSVLIEGGEKAIALSVSLLAIYCVWLGFFKVMEQSGLSSRLARAVYPVAKILFRSDDKEAISYASNNLAANFLGLPGAPTPLGVKATEAFSRSGNRFAQELLFVLNATSLQLLPTTVISLRLAAGSSSPADIFLPTLLSTLLSTVVATLLLFLVRRRK